MKDTALYEHLLGLKTPWSVKKVDLSLADQRVVVEVVLKKGQVNFSQHKISNACAEGFNSAIQLIKANARGFRNFTNYRARILFHCGKLNLAMA